MRNLSGSYPASPPPGDLAYHARCELLEAGDPVTVLTQMGQVAAEIVALEPALFSEVSGLSYRCRAVDDALPAYARGQLFSARAIWIAPRVAVPPESPAPEQDHDEAAGVGVPEGAEAMV